MDTIVQAYDVQTLLPTIEATPTLFWETPPVARLLLTGVGAPGTANLVTSLGEYGYHIVGTDTRPQTL